MHGPIYKFGDPNTDFFNSMPIYKILNSLETFRVFKPKIYYIYYFNMYLKHKK